MQVQAAQSNANSEITIVKTICDSTEFQIYILAQIDESFFNFEDTTGIFKRIRSLIDGGKSVPTSSVLKNDLTLTESMRAILSNKEGILVDKDNVDRVISTLRDAKNKTILMQTLINIVSKQQDYSASSILTSLENSIQKCHSGSSQNEEMSHIAVKDCEKLVEEANQHLSEDVSKDIIPTGFYDFDSKSGGLFRKNVLVVASVPGGGKSTLALQMALHQYKCGFNVCLVSYEMDVKEIKSRLYSNVSKVDHGDINLRKLDSTKKQLVLERYAKWVKSGNKEKDNRITIWTPHRDLTMPQIAMELKPYNYDLIYVDYIGLLYNNPKRALWENLGQHTRDAKMAANSLDAVFVLLAQLDDETNKLKYSKAIQANANIVWTWEYGDREKESGIIEVEQRKSRNSKTFPFYLETDYSTMTFKNYSGPTSAMYDEPEERGKGKGKKRSAADAPASSFTKPVANPFKPTLVPAMPAMPTMPAMPGLQGQSVQNVQSVQSVQNVQNVQESAQSQNLSSPVDGIKISKLPNTPLSGIPKMPQLL